MDIWEWEARMVNEKWYTVEVESTGYTVEDLECWEGEGRQD